MNRRAKARRSVLPWVLGVALLPVGAAAAPQALRHHDHRACLAPGGGGDDTAALQQALDACSGSKRPCAVTLCEGVFPTGILRVRDFRGTLRGAGRERTTLRALPDLEVSRDPDNFFRVDPFEPGQPWPYLLQFIEGEGRVEDLGILVPNPPAGAEVTSGWHLGGGDTIMELRGGLLVSGRGRVDFEVSDVKVEAEDPGTELGTTVFSGVEFAGLLFNPADVSEFPVFPARGRFEVERSRLDGVLTGTSLAEIAEARVRVARNRYRSTIAVDVIDADRSSISVAGNRWTVSFRGVQVRQDVDGAPSRSSGLLVAANRGKLLPLFPGFGDALAFEDPFGTDSPEPGGTSLRVLGNSWTLGEGSAGAQSGITASGTGPLRIADNRLAGRAATGIAVDVTEGCRIRGNSMEDLDTGGGPKLQLGSGTSDCVAIVAPGDGVLDEGSANQVIRR